MVVKRREYDLQKVIETDEELPLVIWSKFVKQRDRYTCRGCGRKDEEYIGICAHHIVLTRNGGKNTMSNGITLCGSCHASKLILTIP